MKHALKRRAIVLAAILATTAILAGCSKEKKETPPPEPEPFDKVVTLYVTGRDNVLNTGTSLTYPDCGDHPTDPTLGTASYSLYIQTDKRAGIKSDTAWIDKGTKYIRKDLPSSLITGIEVIANSDYDQDHPKGSRLDDLLEVTYPNPEQLSYHTMPLMEYMEKYRGLNLSRRFILAAKTPPAKENELKIIRDPKHPESYSLGFIVTLKLTFGDGTLVEIVPPDWGPIPTE